MKSPQSIRDMFSIDMSGDMSCSGSVFRLVLGEETWLAVYRS